jgi:hypothetical protein
MTLAERTLYHLNQHRATNSQNHRAACDYFCMAQVSLDQHNIVAATYRYRRGMEYATEARTEHRSH